MPRALLRERGQSRRRSRVRACSPRCSSPARSPVRSRRLRRPARRHAARPRGGGDPRAARGDRPREGPARAHRVRRREAGLGEQAHLRGSARARGGRSRPRARRRGLRRSRREYSGDEGPGPTRSRRRIAANTPRTSAPSRSGWQSGKSASLPSTAARARSDGMSSSDWSSSDTSCHRAARTVVLRAGPARRSAPPSRPARPWPGAAHVDRGDAQRARRAVVAQPVVVARRVDETRVNDSRAPVDALRLPLRERPLAEGDRRASRRQ